MRFSLFRTCLILLFLVNQTARAQSIDSSVKVNGDLGLGESYSPTPARSQSPSSHLVPYANFDYGNLFGRIDTFGVRSLPVGYGNLELVTRFIDEGYIPTATASGYFDQRKSSIPVGVGTLQVSPWGGVLLNAFHDLNRSGGNLVDLTFAEEIDWQNFAIYPEFGAEYRSQNYVRYFYGISNAEATRTGAVPYQPGAATNLFVDLLVEAKISSNWYINFNGRRSRLGNAISDSPLVMRHLNNSVLVALSYRFE